MDLLTDIFIILLPVGLVLRRPSSTPQHKVQLRRVFVLSFLVRVTIYVSVAKALVTCIFNPAINGVLLFDFLGFMQSSLSVVLAAGFALRRKWLQARQSSAISTFEWVWTMPTVEFTLVFHWIQHSKLDLTEWFVEESCVYYVLCHLFAYVSASNIR